MKTLYEITNKLCGKLRKSSPVPVKDKNGILLTKSEEQLERWREYFEEVLNRPPPDDPPNLEPASIDLNIPTGRISKREILSAIREINSGKAAGIDSIPPEAFKKGGVFAVETMYKAVSYTHLTLPTKA